GRGAASLTTSARSRVSRTPAIESTTARISSTTASSIRVKPPRRGGAGSGLRGAGARGRAPRRPTPRAPGRARASGRGFPGADVGIVALAPRLTVGAEADHVHVAVDAGVEILVGVAPGVGGQPLEVAAALPVARHGAAFRARHQRLQ